LSPEWAREFEWERIQVEWIADTKTVKELEQVLPGDEARLLRVLGNDDHTARMLAYDEIKRRGPTFRNALYWGLRVKDKTIQELSAQLLTRLFDCEHCGGTGKCPSCRNMPSGADFECPERCNYARRFVDCDGSCNWLFIRVKNEKCEYRDLFPWRADVEPR
jgi:hypothetical protein